MRRPGDSACRPAAARGAVAANRAAADAYGPELMRLNDRHDHEFCLGPTHEELVTALVRTELRSLSSSCRMNTVSDPDEVPRRDPPALRPSAQPRVHHEGRLQLPCHARSRCRRTLRRACTTAYERHLRRAAALITVPLWPMRGQIGGSGHVRVPCACRSRRGRAWYTARLRLRCEQRGWRGPRRIPRYTTRPRCEKVETPGVHTIDELAEFLGIPESATRQGALRQGRRGQARCAVRPRRP